MQSAGGSRDSPASARPPRTGPRVIGIESPGVRPVVAKIHIDAPRGEIFDRLIDMSLRPGFTGHFQEDYHLLREESVGEGAGARFRIGDGAGARWMESIIIDTDEPWWIEERGKGGRNHRVPNFTTWELTEEAAGVEVKVAHWTEPDHPADKLSELRLSSRSLRRNWELALRQLKDAVESGERMARLELAGGPLTPR